MTKGEEKLSAEQKAILYEAPILVCILIAGADDDIDSNEIKKSIAFAKSSAKASRHHLYKYYQEVASDFENKLAKAIELLPVKARDRNPVISEKLKQLNEVFKIIEKPFAIVMYASLKELAIKVAKSSGGVLGINAISEEEAEYLDLGMVKDPSLLFK